jgi:asparagine synthetase B (glutamine-hydrolysing)
VETKRVLRRAFSGALPPEVVARKKASFPLPFTEWIADQGGVLRTSEFARALFSEAAVEALTANPAQAWAFAWPVVNVAMWGAGWWG